MGVWGKENFFQKVSFPHIYYTYIYYFSISASAAPITVANCESSGVTK